jgi:hypothetical protein
VLRLTCGKDEYAEQAARQKKFAHRSFLVLKIEIENATRRATAGLAQNLILSRSGYSASLGPAGPWSDTKIPLPRPNHLFAPAVSSSVAAGVLFVTRGGLPWRS